MGFTVDDVQKWYTVRGVSHVVDVVFHGWSHTLCDTVQCGPPDDNKERRPKRICKRCRERLIEAKEMVFVENFTRRGEV